MPDQKNSKAIQAAQLSLPKGGGAIQGIGETFQPNEFSGTASLSIPIFASPCRGFTPQLQLAYSSGTGNGPWGLGFSLSLPQISRQTRKGTPRYQDTDIFILSGSADLVPLDQAPRTEVLQGITYTIQTFAPRQEGLFALIEYWQATDASQSFWRVIGKDHTISIFGKTNQAKIADPNDPRHIFTWLLEESYNTTGDHQLFFYKQENTDNISTIYEQGHIVTANHYMERIQYGNQNPVAESILFNPQVTTGIWHFELVFDYGEYDIRPNNIDPYKPLYKWASRPDPFSGYEAGFEVRTYRRCLHTLMFHRFLDELGESPVLVHATTYDYETNETALFSKCVSVTDIGYSYNNALKIYTTASLPALTFQYIPFNPEGHPFTLLTDKQKQGLDGLNEPPNYTLVDLYGEGLPGILYSDETSNCYREPCFLDKSTLTPKIGPQPLKSQVHKAGTEREIHYGNWQILNSFPSERPIYGEEVMLQDQTGNGQLDVVVTTPGRQGYWEAQADHTWKPFRLLPWWPADFPAPAQTWVDVTGDGIADLVQLTAKEILVYPNDREKGMGSPLVQSKLASMPSSLEASPVETLQFADMAGSGQAHLVRIRNGEVVYWPNLSYGHFGELITMANAPKFGLEFNPNRLFLADLDGSGTTDLIYLQANQALIYLNQSGNAFSDVLTLPLPVPFDNLDQITFADIYGRGNACLVISESHTLPNPSYWCYDFCQGQKPYLINRIDNNLGASTEITYGSSVDFYLADKQAGLAWITPLPFPVQIITQLTHTDAISGSRYVSAYAYHHGYYDGVEREFRGFGRVDRQDAEYFPTDASKLTQDATYVAPSLSRTWYHTGVYLENAELSRQYAQEYYAGDREAFIFPDSSLDWNGTIPDGATIRQAYVAMAGTVLRAEIYGLDDTPQAANPYTVSESNFLVQLRQPKGDHPYAIFYVHAQQSLTYTYERVPQDPQIHQSCILQVDLYGNVERSCAIAYPRRNILAAFSEQQQLKVTCAIQSYVNHSIEPDKYLLGVPIESQNYEITTLLYSPGVMFSFASLQKDIAAALATVSPTNPSSDQSILWGWQQSYYTQVDLQGENTILPLGQVTLPVLLAQQYVAEFSEEQVKNATSGILSEEEIHKKLSKGYFYWNEVSKYWFNPGSIAQYNAPDQFYRVSTTISPGGGKTKYTYDIHQLLLTQVVDPLKNTVSAQAIDYEHLSPMQLVDINGNISEVKLDPLGRVVYTSHYGHEAGNLVGFAPVSQAPEVPPASWLELLATIKEGKEAKYLGQMQSYFYYDPFAWQDHGEPVGSIALVAEQYPNSSIQNRIQIHLSYNDGFGRILCSKSKVEVGESFLYHPDTEPPISWGYTDNRWLTSGSVVYNNKGNPIKQYEPYFMDTPTYVSNPILNTFGVSATLYYDPLGRVTHTVTAKGYLLTHGWTPWEEVMGDANDTFTESPYCKVNILELNKQSIYYDNELSEQDRLALKEAIIGSVKPNFQPTTHLGRALLYGIQYFQATPNRTIIDNLGNVIVKERTDKSPDKSSDKPKEEVLRTFYTYDILGRQLTSADARLSAKGIYNFETTYSLTGAVLKHISADAGTKWSLNNTSANPIWMYDGRQTTTTPSYDPLQRLSQIYVYKTASDPKDPLALNQTVEKFIYGDTPDALISDSKAYNLRGQLYQHYDQAGLMTIPSYSLLGEILTTQRQLAVDYKQEVDWGSSGGFESLLQPIIYQEKTSYDALGRVVDKLDVDGNATNYRYHLSGFINEVFVISDMRIDWSVFAITYNAKGQRLSIKYANTTQSNYSYDPKTWALTNLHTVNNRAKVLQDLFYVYDPVGNVVAKTDNGQNILYYNNQEVTPTATYRYDSLYRLIEGSGREKIGNSEAQAGQSIPLIPSTPHARDNTALQNYIEKYTYDPGNNLIYTQHIAQQDSWSREMVVSETSNRAVISTIRGKYHASISPSEVDKYFDANGNQIQTSHLYPLAWDYRNNLQQAITVKHVDGTYDSEYYVYDGSGQRVRKVKEQYGQGGELITFKEILYLGAIEHIRTLQGQDLATAIILEEYHDLRISDDKQCVATRDRWIVGEPPAGFQKTSWRYHLDDYLGSCTVEVDINGEQISYEEYTPFGSSLLFIGTGSASQLKRYRYSGKERDSVTGFYYYGARYYAPWLVRWLSPDPAGPINGLNLYAFVTDDPETFWDVGGMMPKRTRKGKEQEEEEEEIEKNSPRRSSRIQNNNNTLAKDQALVDPIKNSINEQLSQIRELAGYSKNYSAGAQGAHTDLNFSNPVQTITGGNGGGGNPNMHAEMVALSNAYDLGMINIDKNGSIVVNGGSISSSSSSSNNMEISTYYTNQEKTERYPMHNCGYCTFFLHLLGLTPPSPTGQASVFAKAQLGSTKTALIYPLPDFIKFNRSVLEKILGNHLPEGLFNDKGEAIDKKNGGAIQALWKKIQESLTSIWDSPLEHGDMKVIKKRKKDDDDPGAPGGIGPYDVSVRHNGKAQLRFTLKRKVN